MIGREHGRKNSLAPPAYLKMNDKISRSCYHYQYPPVKYETDLKKQVCWNFSQFPGKYWIPLGTLLKKLVSLIYIFIYLYLHRNASEANAPCCWLFDDGLSGNTKTRALLIRQMNAAADYLRSLQVSNEKKLILLNSNREVLGEVFTHLIKKYGPKRDQEKCVIL